MESLTRLEKSSAFGLRISIIFNLNDYDVLRFQHSPIVEHVFFQPTKQYIQYVTKIPLPKLLN